MASVHSKSVADGPKNHEPMGSKPFRKTVESTTVDELVESGLMVVIRWDTLVQDSVGRYIETFSIYYPFRYIDTG